jgi:hypothetical protein
VKRLIAVLAVSLFAFPAGAFAVADTPGDAPHFPGRIATVAPANPLPPVESSPSAPAPGGSDFNWGDAGIGAGGAFCLLAVALAGGVTFRRRRVRRGSALA